MNKTRFLYFIFFTILYSSCVPQAKIEYLQPDSRKDTRNELNNPTAINYTIRPGDELFIQVYSFDTNTTNPISASAGNLNPYSASLLSYTVNNLGVITFPLLGEIKVTGITLEEAEDLIRNKLNTYLNHPSVNIKLVNTNISVIGYVEHPGNFVYSNTKLNIFQALSLAGDITPYGDRRNVKIIRTVNEKILTIDVDLTKKDIALSPYFYLETNDVVYVRPLRTRKWGIVDFPIAFTLLLSSISTTALLISIFKK